MRHLGTLGVEQLFRNGVLCQELGVTVEIEFRIGKRRRIPSQSALSLLQLHFKGTGINFSQDLTLLDSFAFFVSDTHQLPIHAAADRDGIERGHVAKAVQVNGNVRFVGLRHGNRGGPKATSATATTTTSATTALGRRHKTWLSGAPNGIARNTSDDQQNQNPEQTTLFWFVVLEVGPEHRIDRLRGKVVGSVRRHSARVVVITVSTYDYSPWSEVTVSSQGQ